MRTTQFGTFSIGVLIRPIPCEDIHILQLHEQRHELAAFYASMRNRLDKTRVGRKLPTYESKDIIEGGWTGSPSVGFFLRFFSTFSFQKRCNETWKLRKWGNLKRFILTRTNYIHTGS